MRHRIEPLSDPLLADVLRQAEKAVHESGSSAPGDLACALRLAELSRTIFLKALFIHSLPEGQIRQVQTTLEKIDAAIIPCDDLSVMELKWGVRERMQEFMGYLRNP